MHNTKHNVKLEPSNAEMAPASRICLWFSTVNKEFDVEQSNHGGPWKAQIAPNYAQRLQVPKLPPAGTLFYTWEMNTRSNLN